MKIKKFNESVSENDIVWVAVEFSDGFYDGCTIFSSEMKAWDYFIKIINITRRYSEPNSKPFERFFEDKVRLFRTLNENEDLERAKDWMSEYYKDEQWIIQIEKKNVL